MKLRITVCLLALITVLSLFAGCSAKEAAGDSMQAMPGQNNTAGGMGEKPAEGVNPDSTTGEFERKIIRTVTMSCESKAFDDAVTVIMDALRAHDGYVEASSSSGTASGKRSTASASTAVTEGRRAHYTMRVPAEKLDDFLNALRLDEGIRILSQDMTSNEITATYYDTKTRLETLEAERQSLTEMLKDITDYSDISAMLQVRERLYNVIEEIETLQTKLNLYDSQVAFSTVNLTLREVVEYTVEEVEEPTFGERIGDAFTGSWKAFGRGCQNFAVWFVGAFPTLLVLAAIAAVLVWILLRIKRRHS